MALTGNVIRGRSRIILFMLWFVNNLFRNVPRIRGQNLIQMFCLHGGLSPTLLLYLCILKSNTLTCCGQRRTICSRVWQHFRLRFQWIIWSQRCNRLQNDTHIKLCHLNRQTTTCCSFQPLCLLCLTSQTEKPAWSFASSWLRVISSTWHTFRGPFDKRKAKKEQNVWIRRPPEKAVYMTEANILCPPQTAQS